MTVEEGQILISGLEDTEHFGARLSASLGSVRARTWYTLSLRLPLQSRRKVPCGRETVRRAVRAGAAGAGAAAAAVGAVLLLKKLFGKKK